jgi:hypothetical protein
MSISFRDPRVVLLAQGLAQIDRGYRVRPAAYRFEHAARLLAFLDLRGFGVSPKQGSDNPAPGEIKISEE